MGAETKVSIAEQLREIEREIKMREGVYPRWVRDGKISARDADHRLAAMKAIRESLKALHPQGGLGL